MLLRRRSPTLWFGLVLLLLTPLPASAQTGVIAFLDHCTNLLYAMRGDGSGRIALPLPALPEPVNEYRYSSPWVLDVTTSGPLTVVYYVGIARRDPSQLVDFGLFAVQIDDVGGALESRSPVRLALPANVGFAGVNPNGARQASFAPAGAADRLALVAGSESARVLMTARVDRDDATSSITGLSDLVVVGDLYSIGLPDPMVPSSKGFTGDIDYSPDGTSIVASIYFDLWAIGLTSENTFASADLLTENTEGFAEWKPASSPDGTRIAYTAGRIHLPTGGVGGRDSNIYSLTLATHVVTRVTTNKNKGAAYSLRSNAMWQSDSLSIGFTALTQSTPRRAPCSSLVNSEIFLIRADGSTTATQITSTMGTSVEAFPRWGWK